MLKVKIQQNSIFTTKIMEKTLKHLEEDKLIKIVVNQEADIELVDDYAKRKNIIEPTGGYWMFTINKQPAVQYSCGIKSSIVGNSSTIELIGALNDKIFLVNQTTVKNARRYKTTYNVIYSYNMAMLLETTIRKFFYLNMKITDCETTIIKRTGGGERVLLPIVAFKAIITSFKRKYHRENQWILLKGDSKKKYLSTEELEPIIPPDDRFWADPFLASQDGIDYIFMEEFLFSERKGKISVLQNTENGWKRLGVVLEEPYHLSFPCIIKYKGYWYMVPEAGASKKLTLYKAVDFPLKWKVEKDLMTNVIARDTSIFFYNEKWWMFTSLDVEGIAADQTLYLFYTEDLLTGEWKSHPMNPVVFDFHHARMAGQITNVDGTLIRPAQDCTRVYGNAVHYRKITKLNESEYREEEYYTTCPQTPFIGCHTYNIWGNVCIMDAYKKI